MALLQRRRGRPAQAEMRKRADPVTSATSGSNSTSTSTSTSMRTSMRTSTNTAPSSMLGDGSRFARPVLIKSHTDSVVPQLGTGSPVVIAIRDEWDKKGQGMLFRLGLSIPLKHAFEAFRTRSCKDCRNREKMFFVCNGRIVGEDDSLEMYIVLEAKQSISDTRSPSSGEDQASADLGLVSLRGVGRAADTTLGTGMKVLELVASSMGSSSGSCRLCKKIGYPTSNGIALNGSFSMVYDQTLRRRWVISTTDSEG